MKVGNFEANERYRLFNRNKSTLTVHFYLSTPSSEKIGKITFNVNVFNQQKSVKESGGSPLVITINSDYNNEK